MTREELIEAIVESTASKANLLAKNLRQGYGGFGGGAHRMKVSRANLEKGLEIARTGSKKDLLKFVQTRKDRTNIHIPFRPKGRSK